MAFFKVTCSENLMNTFLWIFTYAFLYRTFYMSCSDPILVCHCPLYSLKAVILWAPCAQCPSALYVFVSSSWVLEGKSGRGEQGERGQTGQYPWDGEEEHNYYKFKSSHLLLRVRSSCHHPTFSLFRHFPVIASAHTNPPILFPPFTGDYFTTFFFSLWKSSLHFVCPAINFSCFIQVPIFLQEAPFHLQSIISGIANSGSRKPILGWLALSYFWP